jgi:hypothetical protein
MAFSKRRALFAVACSLTLSACGDGWETVEYSGRVPYTLERTAGSGIAYVRAKMLPEKELNLTSADHLEKQLSGSKDKGYAPKPKKAHQEAKAAEARSHEAAKAPESANHEVAALQHTEPHAGEEAPESFSSAEPIAPSSFREQPPSIIATAAPQDLPAHGQGGDDFEAVSITASDAPSPSSSDIEQELESAAVQSSAASAPIEAEPPILAPKREVLTPLSQGERELNAIYFDEPQ